MGVYTGTSKQKWSFWTSRHWESLIDMLSKSSRNLSSGISGSSGLQIHNNQSMVKVALTHRTTNLKTTSPSHRKIRVMGRRRRTLESGATSTKSLGTTPMNVTRNSHWWSSSKKKSRTPTQTLIQKTIKGNKSLMQNPLLPSRPQQSNQKNQRILRRGSTSSIHRCG
jgi:hypothetical protein